MTEAEFVELTGLLSLTELEKVHLLAYYNLRVKGLGQFTLVDISQWFMGINLAKPNSTRLRGRIEKDRGIILGSAPGTYRLHAKLIGELDSEYPAVLQKSERIIAPDVVIPSSLYTGTRGYIERLCQQVNASYSHSIFDGCAVLMRRLIEVLLILVYRHLGLESEITDASGALLNLDTVIDKATKNSKIGLSRGTAIHLNTFRKLGNFSAHRIEYNCRLNDLDAVLLEFRVAVEELLYKSGLKV